MGRKQREEWLNQAVDKDSAEQALQQMHYENSQAVQQAQEQLQQHMNQKPEEYVSGYQQQIDTMLDKILNRDGFSYDFSTDPLYHSYKNHYVHQGKLAMQDSLAAVSAQTGGYGSSYAVAAGSQAYQGYLNQLQAKIPALYQAALDRYDSEGNQMRHALDALMGAEKQAQSAYQTEVEQYYKGLKYYTELAESAYQKDYGEYQDMVKSLTDMRDYYAKQDQQNFQRQQDQIAHELAVQKFEESVRQWNERQKESTRRWEAEQAARQARWEAEQAARQTRWQAEMAYKRENRKKTAAPKKKPTFSSKDLSKAEKVQLYLGEMGGVPPVFRPKRKEQIRMDGLQNELHKPRR